MLPDRVEYVVNRGQHILGSYFRSECTLMGLGSLGNMLEASYLNCLDLLVFSYDGRSTFQVVVFGSSNMVIGK